MAITITSGYTQLSGGLVTPSRLNEAITGLTINAAASKLLGTTGAGAISEIGYTAAGLALLQAADLAAQKTILGIGPTSVVESDIAASKGVSKSIAVAGSSGSPVSAVGVFDTANAPSVALTAGTWTLQGSVGATSNYTTPNYLSFWNATDAAEFGGSGAITGNGGSTASFSGVVPVFGTITIASGTKTIIFRAHLKNSNANATVLTFGTSDTDTPAGYILAHKIAD